MNEPGLSCQDEWRRAAVRAAPLLGLDYVDVSDDQTTLTVFFLGKAPTKIEKQNVRISGGTRIRQIQVTGITVHRQKDPALDDSMDVRVDQAGDFSMYTLSVVKLDDAGHPTDQPMDRFDPRYNAVDFSFKAGCPTDLDCKRQAACPPPQRLQPEINYLAKDYASFRQLILDRLAVTVPAWQESHVPDLGITLVELLAYAGDYLSYYQDAVATEAYLDTARQRISVRRHVRLVDYAMHEGCNARTWVTLLAEDNDQFCPAQYYFVTAFPGAPAANPLTSADLANVPSSSYEVFEPLWPRGGQFCIRAAHNEIHLYTWGDRKCCLAVGATSATLADQWVPPASTHPAHQPGAPGGTQSRHPSPAPSPMPPGKAPDPISRGRVTSSNAPPHRAAAPGAAAAGHTGSRGSPETHRALNLHVGDVLIFEEVVGPKTGVPPDADPTHRQAVRLTKVTPGVDKLYNAPQGQPVVEIEWAAEDALTFPLCISAQGPPPDCTFMENVSVARGNVILVDHGASIGEMLGAVPTETTAERCPTQCEPADVGIMPSQFRPTLAQRPLTFSQPIPRGVCSALEMIAQNPRNASPQIALSSIPPAPGCPEGATPPCQIPPLYTFDDILDPTGLAKRLKQLPDAASQFLYAQLSSATRQLLKDYDGARALPRTLRDDLVADLNALLESWSPRGDLLESGAFDPDLVVEMDNDGFGHLRFGDGDLGRMPDAGAAFRAGYRVGNGTAGNVGAETIAYIVRRPSSPGDDQGKTLSGVIPRNPLPAIGGTAPEPIEEVKMFAPDAFRVVLERAIIADDYATLAADNDRRLEERYADSATNDAATADPDSFCLAPFSRVQHAKATLAWTGSWYEALVAIAPAGTDQVDPQLLKDIASYLERYRRIGHDLAVKAASYVPLDLALTVCVLPNYLRDHVEAALLDVFSNRVLPDGRLGFFYPDNLTFGQGIYVSQIVAAAQAVPGVQSVQVARLERYEIGEPASSPPVEPATEEVPSMGVLSIGPFEIARLDNDPNFPENGRLEVDLRGGR
jgi:hypothetical protein